MLVCRYTGLSMVESKRGEGRQPIRNVMHPLHGMERKENHGIVQHLSGGRLDQVGRRNHDFFFFFETNVEYILGIEKGLA